MISRDTCQWQYLDELEQELDIVLYVDEELDEVITPEMEARNMKLKQWVIDYS